MYEKSFSAISERYFKASPWPSVEAIARYADNDHVFCLLYKEMYFRHVYSKVRGTDARSGIQLPPLPFLGGGKRGSLGRGLFTSIFFFFFFPFVPCPPACLTPPHCYHQFLYELHDACY